MKWTHDDLARDLAEYLAKNQDCIIWTDMQLGPSGSPRPDVYKMPKSYSRFMPVAYECKISVSDFRSDITTGKWHSYLKYASAVIFAVPKGLIGKEDIPKGCGLIVRSDSGWRMVKGPTLVPVADQLPKDFWIKLVIDGVHRSKREFINKQMNEYAVHSKIAKKYGAELGEALADRDAAKRNLEVKTAYLQNKVAQLQDKNKDLDIYRQIDKVKSDIEDVKRLKQELCEALGISQDISGWLFVSTVQKQIRLLSEGDYVKSARNALKDALGRLRRECVELEKLDGVFAQDLAEMAKNE